MKNDLILRGIAASPGIIIGPAYLFGEKTAVYKESARPVKNAEEEIKKFEKAIENSKVELEEIKSGLIKKLGFKKANFLDVQILALGDPWIIDETIKKIKEEKREARQAVAEIGEEILEKFKEINDPYLKERTSDIEDVTKRVLENLEGEKSKRIFPEKAFVLVAEDLTPSDTAQLSKDEVLAFLTNRGGKTSHTAIMARALEIPAIVGLREVTEHIFPGVKVIVDGYSGVIVVNPTEKTLKNYEKKKRHLKAIENKLLGLRDLPATTVDGYSVDLSANIEFSKDVDSAKQHGARGIGLYRTEFLYLTQNKLPNEESQLEIYKNVVDSIYPETVIFRTLDLGGDKILDNKPQDSNPFLGWRGIRFSLQRKDIFKEQLRAILRASSRKSVRIMFPMISDLGEIRKAKKVLKEVETELDNKGIEYDRKMEIGIMVEVPSCAILANAFAKEVDFFSIGSNDLTQYILAVDRTNQLVASLYDHLHPAVLKTIKNIVDAAHRHDKWVGVCGEIAGDPLAIPVLLGLEVDELSASPIVIPEVKKIIRTLSFKESKVIARKCVGFSTSKEVRSYLENIVDTKLTVLKDLILGVDVLKKMNSKAMGNF